jgi:hypothetical protein
MRHTLHARASATKRNANATASIEAELAQLTERVRDLPVAVQQLLTEAGAHATAVRDRRRRWVSS